MNTFCPGVCNNSRNAPILLLVFVLCLSSAAARSGSITLYTPNARISVPPGESIDYTIDVINNSKSVVTADIVLSGIPKGWEYELKSGSWKVTELSVLPGDKKSLSLRVGVPMKVNKGVYHFSVIARGLYTLPLTLEVTEEGTFKTEFTTRLPNQEGNANSTFTFNAEIKNRTGEKQLYALRADVQRGWNATFKVGGRAVTSGQVESNATETVAIEIDPPDGVQAGTYKIPVMAATGNTSAELTLEIVVKGSYGLELTTPEGLLSTNVTAGGERRMQLLIRNTGSVPLEGIALSAAAPANWHVEFEPAKIAHLDAGKSEIVTAALHADRQAIAGDYITNLEAKTADTSSKATIRVTVRTSLVWGWIGVLVILSVVGGVYHVVHKYGRR
jgi:uncharacterized membrane protein